MFMRQTSVLQLKSQGQPTFHLRVRQTKGGFICGNILGVVPRLYINRERECVGEKHVHVYKPCFQTIRKQSG